MRRIKGLRLRIKKGMPVSWLSRDTGTDLSAKALIENRMQFGIVKYYLKP